MSSNAIFGIVIVLVAGLTMGSFAWPVKVMRKFQFEHWFFVSMFVGLIIAPWFVTLVFCPDALAAYRTVSPSVLLRSNVFALCWGIANVLAGICIVRIGVALTGAMLAGLGVAVGVTMPMIVKGSGLFSNAPDIGSPAGHVVLIGVAVALMGVALVAAAGFGRDRVFSKTKTQQNSGGFLLGMIMSAIAGVLSCGISFAFVYGQGPIVAAMKSNGAGDIPSNFAVWAVGLMAGGLINVLYPAYIMTKNRSWFVLTTSWKELVLASIIGLHICVAVGLMGKGMLLLGALGASIGFGMQQAAQIVGGQVVGFASGEWRGVGGRPRLQMYLAIAALIVAATIMAFGNTLAKN